MGAASSRQPPTPAPPKRGIRGRRLKAERYARCLKRAYQDFVDSDPQTEKVFSVFRRHSGETRISLDSLRRSV